MDARRPRTSLALAVVGLVLTLSLLRLAASSTPPPSGAGTVSPTTTGLTWPSDDEALPPGTPPPGSGVTTVTTGPTAMAVDAPPAVRQASSSVECRKGANGGATEKGVTADRIKLLGAARLDGAGKDVVQDVPLAWKAVIDAVNRGGGICGRRVTLQVVSRLLNRPVDVSAEDAVGMLLGPLDPDIGDRVRDGSVDRWGLPIVGGDGTRVQFSSSWLWPVDLPTAAFARIGVDEAYRTGSRTFAVVYDKTTAGDAADAVATYLATLDGARLQGTVALDPAEPSYARAANELRTACGQSGCEAVVLGLLPETAKKWMQADGPLGTRRTAAPAWLLNDGFAHDCMRSTDTCETVRFWAGLTPPLRTYRDHPDVARYADDMGTRNAMNPWTTSGYVAARVMVTALQRAGPQLDRASLRAALDGLKYQSGFVSQLDWGPRVPSGRAGNTSARAAMVRTSAGAFVEFVDAGTGWVHDPWPGRFPD